MTFKTVLQEYEETQNHKITNPLLLKAFEKIYNDKSGELADLVLTHFENKSKEGVQCG
jgi:hypothetical protein